MSIVDGATKKPILFCLLGLVLTTGSATVNAQRTFSLKESIAFGLEHNPSVSVAKNNIQNAREMSREALASYLPQVNANVTATNNLKLQTSIIPAGTFGPSEQRISFGQKYTTSVVADASQPIYNRSLLLGMQANRPNTELAQLTLEQTRQNIIYNVASAYFQVIISERQLQLLRSNRDRIQKLLKVSQLQSEAGVTKKVDTKQVQVQLNNVSAQISVAENNVKLSQNALKNAMGIYRDDEALVLSDTARWLHSEPVVSTQPGFRYNNTIDFQLQDKQIQLYDLQAKTIRANNYPTLSLFAQYGLNGFGATANDAVSRMFDYSSLGIRASVSLFDGFRRSAQYRQAVIARDNAKLNQTLNQEAQNLQFQNAGSSVQRAQATLTSNKNNLDLAGQVYDNVALQYREGVGSLSDLLNAESSYSDAQNNYIQSLIDYYLSQLDVERANTTLNVYFESL